MDIAELFDAKIEVKGPAPETELTFFVKRPNAVSHQEFMLRLLGFLGNPDRLIMHHQSGFALVVLPYGRGNRLKSVPWVETVGGVELNPEQFAAITGIQIPE